MAKPKQEYVNQKKVVSDRTRKKKSDVVDLADWIVRPEILQTLPSDDGLGEDSAALFNGLRNGVSCFPSPRTIGLLGSIKGLLKRYDQINSTLDKMEVGSDEYNKLLGGSIRIFTSIQTESQRCSKELAENRRRCSHAGRNIQLEGGSLSDFISQQKGR